MNTHRITGSFASLTFLLLGACATSDTTPASTSRGTDPPVTPRRDAGSTPPRDAGHDAGTMMPYGDGGPAPVDAGSTAPRDAGSAPSDPPTPEDPAPGDPPPSGGAGCMASTSTCLEACTDEACWERCLAADPGCVDCLDLRWFACIEMRGCADELSALDTCWESRCSGADSCPACDAQMRAFDTCAPEGVCDAAADACFGG
jgi:hypothetical protein